MKQKLKGIFPVIPTPFDAEGRIVFEDLERIVDFAAGCGVQGIVVHDFHDEFHYMTDDERLATAETVLRRADGRLPVVVGCSGVSPMKMVDFANHAAAHGAAALLVSAPYLTAYGWDVTCRQGIGPLDRAAELPIILHNAPDYLSAIGPAQVTDLMGRLHNPVYLKDDSQTIHTSITDTLAAVGDSPSFGGVFAGHGAFDMVHEYRRGACGFMLGVQMADRLAAVWQALEAGDLERAERIQFTLARIQIIERLYPTEVSKFMLKQRGIIRNTGSRMTGKPLFDETGVEELNRAIRALDDKTALVS